MNSNSNGWRAGLVGPVKGPLSDSVIWSFSHLIIDLVILSDQIIDQMTS
jgi:hypothetical protein